MSGQDSSVTERKGGHILTVTYTSLALKVWVYGKDTGQSLDTIRTNCNKCTCSSTPINAFATTHILLGVRVTSLGLRCGVVKFGVCFVLDIFHFVLHPPSSIRALGIL
jgi:hypothetical protein